MPVTTYYFTVSGSETVGLFQATGVSFIQDTVSMPTYVTITSSSTSAVYTPSADFSDPRNSQYVPLMIV